ncbi:GntR family transcriptional regulator [Vibrio parahaemolyticus]|uniref:GntR family transcriptional regulator n=1 Tax=Vibrio parahaemolyticus TaxID=670 RepID=UPI00046EAB6B|nr:GntR family transcriptional regulator [Vibrio parahaemolyticus]KIT41080.1 GntR family transcriptional regulator [Vibrio parahaemolyticus 49]EGQ7814605.1 GntR family transcriptional regulator [Vibrio parahaemolyticus]EGQ8732991.1 FCD domain-containing protein [Vibrio parahaemolyticus]EGQ8884940.1 FCD domain-containing protein [Vibrio parahaemolyticus]EGQ8915679.1 FCD domain-containing protein [Vibrio parahaemolyticus]
MSQKPVFKTRTQLVEEAIRTQILKGELKTGQPLRQDALAKEFNVSRIPVREALVQLEAQGLVSFEPHKGATVTELSPDKIDELFELRAVVECHILERAIQNMTDEDLERAREVRERFEAVVNSGDEVEEWSNYNYEFHKALYAPANMPETMDVIYNLNTKCDRYIRMQLLFTTGIKKAEQEHLTLFEMCQNRDIDGAKYLLKKHILEAGTAIRNLLLERQSPNS